MAEIKFEYEQKGKAITEAEKNVIRMLCKERPWEGKETPFYYTLPEKYAAELSNVEHLCLNRIKYSYKLRAGRLILGFSDGRPILAVLRIGDALKIELNPEGCNAVFTYSFPDVLDIFDGWDDIVN